MSKVIAAIERWAREKPAAPALSGNPVSYSYAELRDAVVSAADILAEHISSTGPIALALDNGPHWVVLDLALARLDRAALPLPPFFTASQRQNAMRDCGATCLITDRPPSGSSCVSLDEPMFTGLTIVRLAHEGVELHSGTSKITYTSGSTGAPKGLCLAQSSIETVADSLVSILGPSCAGVHVPLLPLGVLLENVAGLYATLLAGGHYCALSSTAVGLASPFAPDWQAMVRSLSRSQATSTILVPELLRGLVGALEATGERLPHLKLVAVGGARVSPDLLARADHVGLPVVQGYGLSEAASVVSLNTPSDNGVGSVGRLLPHVRAEIAQDGEIVIQNIAGLGYVGCPALPRRYATGDIGSLDGNGRLHVHGRKDHLLITAYGRNVSPEWIESELTARLEIAQAFVFGDGNADLGALIVPSAATVSGAQIDTAMEAVNQSLPEYARVRHWAATMPFSVRGGTLTTNGRLRRGAIVARYGALMNRCLAQTGRTVRFFDRIVAETARERERLYATPQIRDGLAGRISRATYIAYLTQAYHHVRHTVPLLEFARSRLAEDQTWLRAAFDDYIDEERGHDDWILNDIRHAGGDPAGVVAGKAHRTTQRMIDEAWPLVGR